MKLYITASDEVRARRRYLEMRSKGVDITQEEVAKDLAERDRRDASRATAPLVAADDAIVIDTTDLSIEEAVALATQKVQAVLDR